MAAGALANFEYSSLKLFYPGHRLFADLTFHGLPYFSGNLGVSETKEGGDGSSRNDCGSLQKGELDFKFLNSIFILFTHIVQVFLLMDQVSL